MSRCFGDIERMSPRSVQFIPALWAPFQGLWEGSLWWGISRCGFRFGKCAVSLDDCCPATQSGHLGTSLSGLANVVMSGDILREDRASWSDVIEELVRQGL